MLRKCAPNLSKALCGGGYSGENFANAVRLLIGYESFNNPNWERYEVRSPWNVIDIEFRLTEAEPEEVYRKRLAGKNIRGYYSPQHRDRNNQEFILGEMGTYMYRQENCVEFVEPEDQIFSYDEIETLRQSTARPVDLGGIGTAEPLDL
jgi:hypothetical protein